VVVKVAVRLRCFSCPSCGFLLWAHDEGELVTCPDCREVVAAVGLRDVED